MSPDEGQEEYEEAQAEIKKKEDEVCVELIHCSQCCMFAGCFFFFFCVPQLYLWGSPFWVRFVTIFNPTIEVVIFHLCGQCMLGVFFVAGIHLSRA